MDAERAPRSAAIGDAAKARRVLLVEDDPVNRLVAHRLLVQRGLSVELAGTGVEALVKLGGGGFAAVLMDCRMPELDGYETTRRIRASEAPGARLPIVALTAHAAEDERERCLSAGMDDYLTKPLRRLALDAVLERWVGIPAPTTTGEVPPAPTRRDVPLIDAASVHDMLLEFPDIVDQLVALFRDGAPASLDELRDAVARDDGAAIRGLAHRFKGSCQNVGATAMESLCRTLESGACDPADVLARLAGAFEPTCGAITRALVDARSNLP